MCDFVGALGQTQSKISRHLRYLYNAGLVEDRREGLWMHYRISTELDPEQATILKALSEAVGEEREARVCAPLWKRWFDDEDGACDAWKADVDRGQGLRRRTALRQVQAERARSAGRRRPSSRDR